MKTAVLGVVFALSFVHAGPVHAQATPSAVGAKPLAGERERLGYAIGMEVGADNALQAALPDLDLAAFEQSIRRSISGAEPLMKPADAQKTSLALMQRVQARQSGNAGKAPAVSRQQVGELLGINVGRSLAPVRDEFDLAAFMRGWRVVVEKGKPLIPPAEAQALRGTFAERLRERNAARRAEAGERNRKTGEAFLAANRGAKGVVTTRSGLQYQVLKPGAGARPLPSSRVKVDYEGKLLDGKVFDSSYQRGEPAVFALNQVIPGWTEGLGLMAAGAKYRFWIPGDLAYGRRGSPPNIGPNETLVFDVELLDIVK
ncbi:FKBP-type peptidyl-prolyl cis-trans isomerase [Solilutibacter pythonis]|uniref:FKBP-type peptidyl-prolyl cis-trans isomerase n=1 Tax=Solilutibacter pythonis TaxID=2483112 RepID=UPI001FE95444|nr:FKBP-type peptidyl-prolyl cis-trans isomerase [Lysobacter pythonis]